MGNQNNVAQKPTQLRLVCGPRSVCSVSGRDPSCCWVPLAACWSYLLFLARSR